MRNGCHPMLQHRDCPTPESGLGILKEFSLHSKTGKEDKSCHTGDYGILNGVFLLFAAIVLLLKIRVGRSRNFTLCPVMNEFMYDSIAATLIKKFPESHDIRSQKHPCILDCSAEYLRQGVDPLPALLLAHVKTSRMITLKRVVLQIYKYEKQRSATVGSGLLDWIVWECILATFLPFTPYQRKY